MTSKTNAMHEDMRSINFKARRAIEHLEDGDEREIRDRLNEIVNVTKLWESLQ